MEIKKITRKDFDKLVTTDAKIIIGILERDFEKAIQECCPKQKQVAYVLKGAQMNSWCNLKGRLEYDDDLNFLILPIVKKRNKLGTLKHLVDVNNQWNGIKY